MAKQAVAPSRSSRRKKAPSRRSSASEDCPLVQCIEAEYYILNRGEPELLKLAPHHKRILNAAYRPTKSGTLPYRTVVFSCPKKSGKTAIAGAVTYAYLRLYGGNCYSIANDREQAGSRMFARVAENLRHMQEKDNRRFQEVVDPRYHKAIYIGNEIGFNDTGQENPGPHWLQYIASDYAGEAGGMPSLTVWDELWAYSAAGHLRLWDEMQPISNLAQSTRLVTTYAGWHGESHLLWNIYEHVVQPNPHTEEPEGQKVAGLEDLPCYERDGYFVYWDHVARMPWHTPEFMAEARNDPSLKGRESEFMRIWENRWTTGMDAFLPIQLIDQLMAEGEAEGLRNHFLNMPGTGQSAEVAVPSLSEP